MGRSWGQRSLIECNWILLEGTLPGPVCLLGEPGNEATWRVEANPISCIVLVRKGNLSLWISFLCFLKIACFAIPFMLSSEKGKRNPSFWIPFLFLSEKGMFLKKDQRNMRFEFCFAFCLRKEKGNMLPIWFFIPGRSKDVKSAKIHFLENWFLIGRKVLALFIQLKNQFSRKRISADFIVVWPTKKWKINFA